MGRKGIFLTHPFPLLLIFSRSIASPSSGKEPALRKEAEIKVTACFDRWKTAKQAIKGSHYLCHTFLSMLDMRIRCYISTTFMFDPTCIIVNTYFFKGLLGHSILGHCRSYQLLINLTEKSQYQLETVKNSKETQGSQKQKWRGKIGEDILGYLIYLTLVYFFCHTNRNEQAIKQTNKQTNRQTDRQKNKQQTTNNKQKERKYLKNSSEVRK